MDNTIHTVFTEVVVPAHGSCPARIEPNGPDGRPLNIKIDPKVADKIFVGGANIAGVPQMAINNIDTTSLDRPMVRGDNFNNYADRHISFGLFRSHAMGRSLEMWLHNPSGTDISVRVQCDHRIWPNNDAAKNINLGRCIFESGTIIEAESCEDVVFQPFDSAYFKPKSFRIYSIFKNTLQDTSALVSSMRIGGRLLMIAPDESPIALEKMSISEDLFMDRELPTFSTAPLKFPLIVRAHNPYKSPLCVRGCFTGDAYCDFPREEPIFPMFEQV